MSPSHGDETYVLDACVVIDFCGRTDNLEHLLAYVGDSGVVTSEVVVELRRQREKNFRRLGRFLDLVDDGTIQVVDPDLSDADAARIIRKWSSQFGAGEVSSAAVALTNGWVFVSRDFAPMRQLRLTESMRIETTDDVLSGLVRARTLSKPQAQAIQKQVRKASARKVKRR